jgi:glycosyltransferase involved in cell wall biosynthesis
MTTISVVVPFLDARTRIEEALASIRSQTYSTGEIETILVVDRSNDLCVRMAGALLQRHNMRGTAVVTDGNYGASTTLNRGWQAAAGDWIQFLDANDLLAPDKFEVQLRHASQLPDVICSSWQHLERAGDAWKPVGTVKSLRIAGSMVLKLVSHDAGTLGPALFRRQLLEKVGGFSDGLVYPNAQHLLLKLWGQGGKFVEAPSLSPLYFAHQPTNLRTADRVDLARRHLQNVVVAEAMLRQQKPGVLAQQDKSDIARLCSESLSVLYDHDWAAFQQYWQWLREVVPGFVPQHSTKLKLATLVVGYENAAGFASVYRWTKSIPGRVFAAVFGARQPALYEEARATLVGRRSRFASVALAAVVAVVISLVGITALSRFGEHANSANVSPDFQVSDSSRRSRTHPIPAEPRPLTRTDERAVEGADKVRPSEQSKTAEPTSRLAKVEPDRRKPPVEPLREPATPGRAKGPDLVLSRAAPDRLKPPAERLSEPATSAPAKAPEVPLSKVEPDRQRPPAASLAEPATPGSAKGPDLALSKTEPDRQKPPVASLAEPATPAPAKGPDLALSKAEPDRQRPPAASLAEPATPGSAKGPDLALSKTEPDRRKPQAESPPEPAAPGPAKGPDLALSRPEPDSQKPALESQQPEPTTPRPAKEPAGPAVPPAETTANTKADEKAGERAASGEAEQKIAAVAVETQSPSIALAPVQPSTVPVAKEAAPAAKETAPVAKEIDAGTAASSAIPTLSTSEREAAEKLVARGERHLADGNVALARQFLLRAANLGLARAAVLLATTYDPKELARLGAVGVQPDLAAARKWYERAHALGAPEAKELLARLTGR